MPTLSELEEPRSGASTQALSGLEKQILLAPALALWGLIERACLRHFFLEDISSRAVNSLRESIAILKEKVLDGKGF
jgi:hypothetical protein